jgi:hypothetical protein
MTDEWSPLDPTSGYQRKYYAPGVGHVRVGAVGDPEAETLVLVKLVQLCTRESAQVNQDVLKLDHHAYQVSKVYRHTPPTAYALPAGRCM